MECPESLRCVEVKMDEAGILRKMTRSKPGKSGTEKSTKLKGRDGSSCMWRVGSSKGEVYQAKIREPWVGGAKLPLRESRHTVLQTALPTACHLAAEVHEESESGKQNTGQRPWQ